MSLDVMLKIHLKYINRMFLRAGESMNATCMDVKVRFSSFFLQFGSSL